VEKGVFENEINGKVPLGFKAPKGKRMFLLQLASESGRAGRKHDLKNLRDEKSFHFYALLSFVVSKVYF